ncbi:MAG: hypothetical protein ABL911_08390 [Gallionella sp.]
MESKKYRVYAYHAITHEPILMFVVMLHAYAILLSHDLKRAGLDGEITEIRSESEGEQKIMEYHWNED